MFERSALITKVVAGLILIIAWFRNRNREYIATLQLKNGKCRMRKSKKINQ